MKYICNTTCWVAGRKKAMFTVGEIVEFEEDEIVPGHFTCIEKKEEELPKPVVEETPTPLLVEDSIISQIEEKVEDRLPRRKLALKGEKDG